MIQQQNKSGKLVSQSISGKSDNGAPRQSSTAPATIGNQLREGAKTFGREVQRGWNWLNSSAADDQDAACFPHGCSNEEMRSIENNDRNRQNVNTALAGLGAASEAVTTARGMAALVRQPTAPLALKQSSGDPQKLLIQVLRQLIQQKAGFNQSGVPIILDVNLSAKGMADALRNQGYNVRTVQEIFGTGRTPDAHILELARAIDGRVLTRDVGRQLDGGFFEKSIVVDSRVRTSAGVSRILEDGLK